MILYEHEGKQLFASYGILVPKGILIHSLQDIEGMVWDRYPCVLKTQILQGKRGLTGGIQFAKDKGELIEKAKILFSSSVGDERPRSLLVEEKVPHESEWYLSITYSTRYRAPLLLFSFSGGSHVEEQQDVYKTPIHPVRGFEEFRIRNFFLSCGIRGKDLLSLVSLSRVLYTFFTKEDAHLVEINPLVRTAAGQFFALDSKIILDTAAAYRHSWHYEERTVLGRLPTERERGVRAIDQGEFYYRGTAGKYIEFDGDIACLFSGGGASISMMDALAAAGGKPANYTEYSGNPPREKVYELAKIVFSKEGLRGIWIVGGVANFTHVGETMAGIADALREMKPKIPIIIRRAGPFEQEGRAIMESLAKEAGLRLRWYGREITMTETAKILMDTVNSIV